MSSFIASALGLALDSGGTGVVGSWGKALMGRSENPPLLLSKINSAVVNSTSGSSAGLPSAVFSPTNFPSAMALARFLLSAVPQSHPRKVFEGGRSDMEGEAQNTGETS